MECHKLLNSFQCHFLQFKKSHDKKKSKDLKKVMLKRNQTTITKVIFKHIIIFNSLH